MARYAAIDIGSNSIRMEAAEVIPGTPPRVLASERDVTRLGQSVFQSGRISEEAMVLTCSVLARMAAVYRALDVVGVRAVGTASVRDARNQSEFLERASAAIGSPVEVITGREEARLIEMGVQSRWPHPHQRVLIVDIGGGSAEIIASEEARMRDAVSKPLGAVRLWEIFLSSDPPAPRELHRMHDYIQERLAGLPHRFGGANWDRVIATSGTAAAVLCAIAGVPRAKRDRADRVRASTAQVRKLAKKLSALDLAARRKVTGIGPRRAEIIVPGITVLLSILEQFQARSVNYCAAGVRDGIIADLAGRGIGRELAELSREQRKEVERLAVRFGVPLKHGRKVAALAATLFNGFQSLHNLGPAYGKLLQAAAYLHDVGHYVNDQAHHKHSYYLVANSDMSGFTNREREFIANLCRYHRKAMPASDHNNHRGLDPEERRSLLLLIPLLRIADNLDRSGEQRIESISCLLRNGQPAIALNSSVDIELEQWAAERAGELFRHVYGRPVSIAKA
ncbi:MAG TPA: Ppx/GppA phosphatase family protein [Bryobacteraceae bacterium]|nr:Ppx/GppA phosphatase family protein [Bryobacteraceae bacterium]